uniref:hypothetical protein n=1 Tax=Poseidonia sp. TaxID=2666344 RepID=UPI003F6989A5
MGGLLDKANAAKDAEIVEETPSPVKASGHSEPPTPVVSKTASAPSPAGNPDTAMKINLAGWVIILIGAILSLQGGAWGFIVVSIVLVLGIGAIVQADRMRGGLNKPKLYASIGAALLISTLPYAAVMLVPTNASMAITEVSLDEDSNELSFKVRGTMSSVDVSIEADGVEVWADSGEINNDLKKFTVSLSDIFSGNGEDYAGNSGVEYIIKGVGSNDQTDELLIPSRFVTREAQDVGVRITALQDSQDAEKYVGITMETLIGLLRPTAQADDGGVFSEFGLTTIDADYSVNFKVTGGSSWDESTISVNGNLATWTPQGPGTGSASTDGWFGLSGSGTDNAGVPYLDKSEFYDGEGCYTFTAEIVNVLGDQATFTSEYSWQINLDSGERDSNNNPTTPKGYGIGETC